MQRHMQDVRSSLTGLGLLAHQTREAEKNIHRAATQRLESINNDLAKLKPDVLTDPSAADRYRDLIMERGHLHAVIGRSRRLLTT